MASRVVQATFAGGEVSPSMYARVDDAKYQSGAALVRNLIIRPQGAASRRPGLAFVHGARGNTTPVLLLPFIYNNEQSVVVEVGHRAEYPGTSAIAGYMRFHTQGATLVVATTWSATTAYVVGDQVFVGGTLYRCIVAHTNNTPPNTTYWNSLEYVPNLSFLAAAVNTTAETITFSVPHGLQTDDIIEFTYDAGGGLPTADGGDIAVEVLYAAIRVDDTTIQLARTVGGSAINLTSQGSGTMRMHFRYSIGDVASYLGRVVYCRVTRPIASGLSQAPSVEAYWYVMPTTLEYEIPSPYQSVYFPTIVYGQSGDILSLAEPNYPVYELRRYGALDWRLVLATFGSSVSAPTTAGITGAATPGRYLVITSFPNTPGGGDPKALATDTHHNLALGDEVVAAGMSGNSIPDGAYVVWEIPTLFTFRIKTAAGGAITTPTGSPSGSPTVRLAPVSSVNSNSYKLTSVDAAGIESTPSGAVTVTNNLFVSGSYNTLSWSSVTGAARYRVYKENSGLYGLIGETDGTSFKDDNIAADLGRTPPYVESTFNTAGNYPAAVTHFEQRRMFGGSLLQPRAVYGTRSGTESDLSYHLPVQPDDRIYVQLAAEGAGTIRHLAPLPELVVLTSSGELRVSPVNSDALTPESLGIRPLSYVGSSIVRPVLVDAALIFCAARGGHVYELRLLPNVEVFEPADVSIRASHLFDNNTISYSAHGKAPYPLLWFVNSEGVLLGLTYVPAERVYAWHRHETSGVFESLCVVPEGGEDVLYVSVRRTVNSTTVRYIERMKEQTFSTLAASFHVDSGLTYVGGATSVISGLGHLEGREVQVCANGVPQANQTVVSAAITLETPVTEVTNIVHVGLAYTSTLKTLPVVTPHDAHGEGRRKNVARAWVRVIDSVSFQTGPDALGMSRFSDTTLQAGPVEHALLAAWSQDGQIIVQQDKPQPLTVVGLTLEVSVGGG